MGAVHGVVLKYVGLTAAASAALAVGPAHYAWRCPLLVVAATNAVVVALFLADAGCGLLGKSAKTGRSPWPYYVAWAGFVVPTWLYTKIHTSLGATRGVPEASEVAPGWWLGGRYADVAPGRPARWAGVLDLTCELPERCLDLTDDYKLVACWDGAPPAPERIEAAAAFCVAARAEGPVLVHCAHGRGRSTTCVVAALAKAGLFPDWRAALAACQRNRPVVKLNGRMRRALDLW
eukprot:CAMPEP_0119270600 /NCGR_PEP_ID=MMETSP1329-20130426/7539_1 /TAXON_ID=114041 /ORGANISM="Genus nov. species nov., Strain RCC1024" /LENGTH=233 /DNA_ID=CAMNT_0007270625 /DNA_START=210 /DNA_END=908 /DNA_ORIENTATION=+